jgi:N-acylglucosamine-6-phosphate 2-epimerase
MVQERKWECISRLDGGLIASCQASTGEPLCHPEHILAMSLSAVAGGAVALRLEGTDNIKAVRESQKLPPDFPIVGLIKSTLIAAEDRLKKAYITSTFEEAKSIVEAGADIVALDATGRDRPDGSSVAVMIERIHDELKRPVWADCATFSEGIAAAKAGADIVSTTLFGYTEETKSPLEQGPALDLLKNLCDQLEIPVILEGRVWHPYEVTEAFEQGAYAVVVGSAITRPTLIAERFVKAIPLRRPKKTLA